MRKTLRRIQDISQKKLQDVVSFVSAQSIMGTPHFLADEFEWAQFRNVPKKFFPTLVESKLLFNFPAICIPNNSTLKVKEKNTIKRTIMDYNKPSMLTVLLRKVLFLESDGVKQNCEVL